MYEWINECSKLKFCKALSDEDAMVHVICNSEAEECPTTNKDNRILQKKIKTWHCIVTC